MTDKDETMEDEINFLDMYRIIWKGKWVVFSSTILITLLAILYSLSLPNIYQSSAILSPNEKQNSMSAALENYSGLASLAGVNIPTQANVDNASNAIVKMVTFSFFEDNLLPNIYLPNLLSVKSWNHQKNELIYDGDIYDKANEKWVRDFSYPQKQIPSARESFETFHEGNFSISEDKKTGFVTVSMKHYSPYIAKEWAQLIVNQINIFYSEKDRKQAEKSIDFLNTKIIDANFSEIKDLMAQLLKQEIQKLTLLEANKNYVFEFIDPPSVQEEKIEPQRALICIFGFFIGVFIGITYLFLFNIKNNN